jgi:menaquinone-specific isochorismate synthase
MGVGPFEESAEMPGADTTAFYVNDFALTDLRPWKIPASVRALGPEEFAGSVPRLVWEKPPTEGFKMTFRRIRREVLAGRLQKMVPVLTERGQITSGTPLALVRAVLASPNNVWGYGRVIGDNGFLGATPELLFKSAGCQVETMALAGTAKPGADEAFLADVKEIEEHEIVANFLVEQLQTLGKVERSEREMCETSGLRHFRSTVRVSCAVVPKPDELVKLLHPTPAVGCLPRTPEWLAKLREYRIRLRVPEFFGAPFGFSHQGQQHFVVSIRGLGWQGNEAMLSSGCGIVAGSAFDHEWRELRLKREAVLRTLGLDASSLA